MTIKISLNCGKSEGPDGKCVGQLFRLYDPQFSLCFGLVREYIPSEAFQTYVFSKNLWTYAPPCTSEKQNTKHKQN